MPVVTLYFNRLGKLLGRKTSKKKITEALPFLGLDIEEEAPDHLSVEYSPNRPDFSTDYGISVALQGLLGFKTGLVPLKIKKSKDAIRIDSSVAGVRPYLIAIEARGGKLDDETIRQIIAMQEDLHNGIGRRRKKASIGIHDLDKIKFPLSYLATARDHRFLALNLQDEMKISDMLVSTEIGKTYKHLLEGYKKVPVIIDSSGNTISFPPIVNSSLTEVNTGTKNLLVEVTATNKTAAEDTLSIVAFTLQSMGFKLYSVRVTGPRNFTPSFSEKKMSVDSNLVRNTLGLDVPASVIIKSLRKCRLDAKLKGKKILCTIPRYRPDMLGPIDIVEEVALGYGIQNFEPTIPPAKSAGQKNKTTILLDAVKATMIGLGYSQIMNFGLVGKKTQYDLTKRNPSNMIYVADSKSQEHQILRDLLMPGLIDILSRNIHEQYPQKIFEIGTVFHKGDPVVEEVSLGCLSAHNDVSYTEIKSILQSLLKSGFGIDCTTRIAQNPLFVEGRTADVFVGGQKVGTIGEISAEVLDNFKLRIPLAGFEIRLSGLMA